MASVTLILLSLFILATTSATAKTGQSKPYVDATNPYKQGQLSNKTVTLGSDSGAPVHTTGR